MNKKTVFAWSMFDFANTIFSALFITYFFPFFVKTFLHGNELQLGITYGISMLLVGLFVPLIGAWSDRIGKRIPFVLISTLICCIAVALTGFVPLWFALFCGLVANFFYHSALTTYNALMPRLAKSKIGMLSGIGVFFGYIGTLIALAFAWPVLDYFGWETKIGSQAVFILAAVLFMLFSLLILAIKETGTKKKSSVHFAFSEVISTIKSLKKSMWYFLTSMFLLADGISTVILFLFLYAQSVINLGVKEFFIIYAVFSVAAAIISIPAGYLVDKFNPKKILIACALLWIFIICYLIISPSFKTFIIAGILGGFALGIYWTANRPMLLKLAPKHKVGQFFGFMEFTDKWSGVLGPIIFGFLVINYSYAVALMSLLVFFVLGLVFLLKIK